ncbi:hydrocephalus-inducing protein homolog [Dryobates pubescens]|uniref:hydrocephalus-inducing protein homolog n=1 Tax=Dryobates pubescens TaxID=118200 RepID=UPI0023BA34C8|nr:hydrocephalus-inducing protein homolog [Dryobates pubescens]
MLSAGCPAPPPAPLPPPPASSLALELFGLRCCSNHAAGQRLAAAGTVVVLLCTGGYWRASAMATGKSQRPRGGPKGCAGIQSSVLAPGHLKLVTEAKEPVPVSSAGLGWSCFEPCPPELLFQDFVPHQLYQASLVLRNKDKVPRQVKVTLESSPCFRLLSPRALCPKVAPGRLSAFRVLFTPEESKVYRQQLLCSTAGGSFPVPIRALPARPALALPRQLRFPLCPVGHSTQRTLLLHNLGPREAHYSLSTGSPFSAAPSGGALGAGAAVQLTVEFLPLQSGEHHGALTLHSDTGGDLHTSLHGTAQEVNIRLDRSCLALGKTFLSLSQQGTVLIHNGSDVAAHFQWKACGEQEEQQQQRLVAKMSLKEQEGDGSREPLLEPALHPQPCHSCQKQRVKVQGDSMLISEGVFTIQPVEGELWPRCSAEVQVTFQPQAARLYEARLCCHISGCELRLPLHVRGEGLGPLLRFHFDQLDVGKVFVGATNTYKAILLNRGPIEASFSLVPPATALGSCFTFLPWQGLLLPGGVQVIQISFSSPSLGHFTEEFRFHVEGSPEPVTLTIRGCVTAPTFHFDVPGLHFGEVSFGFPRSLSCRLTNSSPVPMAFALRVPGDGAAEPSVPSAALLLEHSHPAWGRRAQGRLREFSISPCRGTIRPLSSQDIQVTLCSNTVGPYELALVLDVDGVGQELFSLPLTARCVVPALSVPSPVVPFGRCYLQLPARRLLTLVNDSDLPGCYGLLPQAPQEDAAVLYSSPVPCGIIQAHSSVEVPLSLAAQVPGEQDTVAHLMVFGCPESPLEIHLVSRGEGPVVSVHPSRIHFGSIQVLQEASRSLQLCNQSPIPAPFRAQVAAKGSCWRVEPSQGVIPPEGELCVAVVARLADTGLCQAKVQLQVEHSPGCAVPVQALGVGSTTGTHRPLAPQLRLGTRFRQQESLSVQLLLAACQQRMPSTARGSCRPPLGPGAAELRLPPRLGARRKPSAAVAQPGRGQGAPSGAAGAGRRQLPCRSPPALPRSPLPSRHSFRTGNRGRRGRPLPRPAGSPPARGGSTEDRASRGAAAAPPGLRLRPPGMEPSPGRGAELLLEGCCGAPQREQLLCQAVVGREARRTQVTQVASSCQFIAPALQMSSTAVTFRVEKGPGDVLRPQYQPLSLKNICSLPLSITLALEQPFSICDVDLQPLPAQPQKLEAGQDLHLCISFNPAHEEGLSSWRVQQALRIQFLEHPQEEQLLVQGEVFFPNLHFQTMAVDFGCILNDTEALQSLEMTNCSPLPVHYCWLMPPRGRCSLPAPTSFTQAPAAQEEEASSECSASAGSCSSKGGAQEPAQGLAAAGDPAQEPADDSLEAKVFDVLPLHGVLQPGQSQQVTFSFFGHPNVVASATALCRVQGGPSYQLSLRGEASLISYLLEPRELDVGLQLCDVAMEAEVTLQNSGKLPFTFVVLSPSRAPAHSPLPGVPLVVPSTGSLGAGQQQLLKVSFVPGQPGGFCTALQVRVAHLELAVIRLRGQGGFPRICLDLPRKIRGNTKYERALREVRERLAEGTEEGAEAAPGEAAATEPPTGALDTVLDTGLQMQLEDLLIKQQLLEQQQAAACSTPQEAAPGQSAPRRLLRAELPEHILDLGWVAAGSLHTHPVRVSNPGQLPVALHIQAQVLRGTGFSVDLERVRLLPCCQPRTFQVCFQPPGDSLAAVEVLLPIKVAGGPRFGVLLRARVAVPSLSLSRDRLEFSRVQCGQCQEETVRLYNQQPVPCQWALSREEPAGKVEKPLAGSRRRLQGLQAEGCAFEVLPSAGVLAPGHYCDLQVRFCPLEEKPYRRRLRLSLGQGRQPLELLLWGRGLEPRLELQPQLLALGPVLPSGPGAQGTVLVRNPCDFPIEFYSLEFDQQYLAEEEILRSLGGYSSRGTLLLPLRSPGELLPAGLLEVSQGQKRLQQEQAKPRPGEAAAQDKGAAAPRRGGIVVIVHGAPLAGKTSAAAALAQRYGAACLRLEAVLSQALELGSGLQRPLQPQPGRPGAASCPRGAQRSDCCQGVVFDGLETSFASSMASALLCLLKAVGNCPHIYFVNLLQDYGSWQARQRAAEELQGLRRRPAAAGRGEAAPGEQRRGAPPEQRRGAPPEQQCGVPPEQRHGAPPEQRHGAPPEQRRGAPPEQRRGVPPEQCGAPPEQRRGAPPEQRRGAPPEQCGAPPEQRRGAPPEQRRGAPPEQCGAPPEQRRGAPPEQRHGAPPEQRRGAPPEQRRGAPPEQCGAPPEQRRGAPPEQRRGVPPEQRRGVPPEQQTSSSNEATSSHREVTVRADQEEAVQEHPDSAAGSKEEEEKQSKEEEKQSKEADALQPSEPEQEEPKGKGQRESEKSLALRFKAYEASQKEVAHILSCWDRVQGVLLAPAGQGQQAAAERHRHASGRGSRDREQQQRLQEQQQQRLQEQQQQRLQEQQQQAGGGAAGSASSQDVGVPCLAIEVLSPGEVLRTLLESSKLPRAEQVLGELGLGALGPPIPSTAFYSVVQYPARRELPAALQQFTLVVPGEKEDASSVVDARCLRLPLPARGRWVLPARGQLELQVHFSSLLLGTFEQRLHFELLGTRRPYQLLCRGTCLYPTICQEPGVVFPRCRRSKAADAIISKEFVLSTGVFHFGPLLCGKSRAWYKALQHPSNCEKITILNATPLEAEVSFSFQRDGKADTFLLEPPSMKLKAKEKQELSLWAYPTSAGLVEDSLICSIKDNPEPVVFRLCCQGVQVELGVSPKQLQFSRVLLHREQSRTLLLQNRCPLPLAWQLSGLEPLGQAFSVSQRRGSVGPRSELALQLCFKATKALSVKKMICLEVSDAENLQGIVQVENIQVQAEAYDVALDISVPKGAAGCVDFGVLRVLEAARQELTLRNQGKYEIAFRFRLDTTDPFSPELLSHLSVQPEQGLLPASEHPVPVQLLFHPKREISIEARPILLCQVIEPSLCAGGEAIAVIPVKLSARAVFSHYSISPASPISFGAMVSGSRRACSLLLENRGLLPFEFLLCRAGQGAPGLPGKSAQLRMQAALSLGPFTVCPASGCLRPGEQQLLAVECCAGLPGPCQEQLLIHISHRDPEDSPLGIPYTLLAESCLPAFLTDDLESIFEEHRLCSSGSGLWGLLQAGQQEQGVFLLDQHKFLFPQVLLGQQARARFKLRNVGRVPCTVLLSLRPGPGQLHSHPGEAFRVDPARLCVPSCSQAFAAVTFTPQRLQSYHCTFEAALDVQTSPAAGRAQRLSFELSGEGKLPEVRVLRPARRDRRGKPLLLFRRLPLGAWEKLPLVLHNAGTVPAQVLLDLLDEEGVFFLKAKPSTKCLYQGVGMQEDSAGGGRRLHTASLLLQQGQAAELEVGFKPTLPQRLEGKLQLSVLHNPYEETTIRLLGEGHQEDCTLDNIQGLGAEREEQDLPESSLEDDSTEAVPGDHIQLGDCAVGTPCTATFTLTNRSRGQALRFCWLPQEPFRFCPQVGHLHAGCAKDIRVTLKSDIAATFRRYPVKCQVSRICFQLPAEQVPDWDDRLAALQWVDATRAPGASWPGKRKVRSTSPKPAHSVLEGSSSELQLLLSAVVAYAEFQLDTAVVDFQDTFLFHTRTFSFPLSNTGSVALEYSWVEAVEQQRAGSCPEELLEGDLFSSTAGSSVSLQPSPCLSQLGHAPGQLSSTLSSCLEPSSATPAFSIEPHRGSIPAGQEQLFQLKFSPLAVGDFQSRMLCRIPNLKPGQKGPEVAVKGRSLAVSYHFELEASECSTARGLSPQLQEPHPSSRVLEFAAVGVGCRRSRTFLVLNPTSSAFSFLWSCQDPAAPPAEVAFSCLLQRGQILPGQKAEMRFEFVPWHLGTTESRWLFTIPEQEVSVPFLLLGKASDPLVALERSHLNLQLLLIGQEVQQSIMMINSEKEAFSFAFRASSLFAEGSSSSLKVEPLAGSIAALARLPITVTFTPREEGEVVFNLRCDVKRKPQPLSLNIKATGYSVAVAVQAEDSQGHLTQLSTQQPNIIDLREVQLHESTKHTFTICNRGRGSFTFSWELRGAAACRELLSISPQLGTVQAEGTAEAQLAFHPQRICSLKDVELVLQISKGPTFTCVLLATVVVPRVHFSTTRLNFGACFLSQAGLLPATQTLLITNKADRDLSLACSFPSTAQLQVECPCCILQPGGTVEVPITFSPREVGSYQELIPFEINGLCQQSVEVRGRGVEMKVDVVDPPGKVVKLGALCKGQVVKKVVTIANNSAAPITFKLSLKSTPPELQEPGVLSLSPSRELRLEAAGGSRRVEVTFAPRRRLAPFTQEVLLAAGGLGRCLFVLQGSCQGPQVSLERQRLSFGAVVRQGCGRRRVAMRNGGERAARFKWDLKSFEPDFSISPTEGHISPGTEVPLVVTFRPSRLSHSIRCQGLQCFIQGGEPLLLSLEGCCLQGPVAKETLCFACEVRGQQSQTILLSNPSDLPWSLQPVLEGEHWQGPPWLHLEANQQQKPYVVTYCPLTMTSESEKHQGSIFFPLPDGEGLCYRLQGTAAPPGCSGRIRREVPCRTSHTQLLPVCNWLSRAQRFLVLVDILQPEKLESSPVLKGLKYLVVPGSARRDYKLTFLSSKEGVFSTKVTFLNEVTKEYLFYLVTFQASPAGPLSRVGLPSCQAALVLDCQPLAVAEGSGCLLRAPRSKPEQPLRFCTTLGSRQTISTTLRSYAQHKTQYQLQTSSAAFQTQRSLSVSPAGPGGSELSLEVTFEPCQLGEAQATLQLSSALGTQHSIPLLGLALPPQPQGPFPIRAGSTVPIPFQNIFQQPMAFQYQVEHPSFSVRAPESLPAKATTLLHLSFRGATPATSRMVVTPRGGPSVSWVYYLQGLPPSK